MRIGRNVIDNYGGMLDGVRDKVAEQLLRDLSELDTANVAKFFDEAVAITQAACDVSAASAAELAATFYDTLREMQIGEAFGAEPVNARNQVATERAIRSVEIGKYPDTWPSEVIKRCTERVSSESKKAAGETVTRNAMRDPAKPKFARVPSGVESCEFCMMLASRGFVYASRKAAGENEHYHPNCRCRIVPSFGSTEIEGYDPDAYYDMWKNPEKHPELREARNARRRELYAERKGTREQAGQ